MRVLSAALALVLAAGAAQGAEPTTVRVFAASSLGDAFRALATELEAAGIHVELNLAGTQVLRTQIEQGAAADVYAFADLQDGQALEARGLVQPQQVFARNALCVVTPRDRPRVRSLRGLAEPGVKVVLAAPTVPAGRYAAQALDRIEAAGGLGPGFRARVLGNVVSQEPNVRLVLAKVALGEADAGFVYLTDARGNARVVALPIPEHLNVVARYGIGLVRADASAAARTFVQAVLGPAGRRVLGTYGFGLPLMASALRSSERPEGLRALVAASTLLPLFLVLPILALVTSLAPSTLLEHLRSDVALRALWLTLRTTAITTVAIVVLGTPLAYLLARRSFRGREALDTLIDLPVTIPPIVAGVALLMAFGRRGLIGHNLEAAGFSIPFSTAAVVLAQLFIASPFYVKAARAGFAAVDPRLEDAARTLGASPWRAFRTVTLPLAAPALVAGTVLAWSRALSEFGATIMFAGNLPGRTQTLTLAVMTAMESDVDTAVAVATLALLLATGALLVARALARRFAGRHA